MGYNCTAATAAWRKISVLALQSKVSIMPMYNSGSKTVWKVTSSSREGSRSVFYKVAGKQMLADFNAVISVLTLLEG